MSSLSPISISNISNDSIPEVLMDEFEFFMEDELIKDSTSSCLPCPHWNVGMNKLEIDYDTDELLSGDLELMMTNEYTKGKNECFNDIETIFGADQASFSADDISTDNSTFDYTSADDMPTDDMFCGSTDTCLTPRQESTKRTDAVSPRRDSHLISNGPGLDENSISCLFDAIDQAEYGFESPTNCSICHCRLIAPKTIENFTKHIQDEHLDLYIEFQYRRIQSGRIIFPKNVKEGEYLRLIMRYIGDDKSPLPTFCLVPGCNRSGKDRNILSGHFRGGHKKTYTFCQLLLKGYNTDRLNDSIKQLDLSFEDSQHKKRRYSYMKSKSGCGNKENTGTAIKSKKYRYSRRSRDLGREESSSAFKF